MADKNLRLQIQLQLAEKVLGPLKAISQGSTDTAQTLKAAREQLKQLQAAQGDVSSFQKLQGTLSETQKSLIAARNHLRETANAFAETDTSKTSSAMLAAKEAADKLGAKFNKQQQNLKEMSDKLKAAGIDTQNLAVQEKLLGDRVAAATADIAKQTQSLKLQAEMQRRMAGIKKAQDANVAARGNARGALLDGVALAAALGAPIKMAMDWEQRLAELNKVANKTPGELNAIANAAQKLAVETGVAREEIVGAYIAASQAGFAESEWSQFAEVSAKMGVAFDTTGEKAGEMLKAWRAGMNLSMDQAAALAGAVNHIANNMNATAMDISEVLMRQGAVMKGMGLSDTQSAALAATMLSGGATAEIAATAGKNFMGALTKGFAATKSQREIWDMIGLNPEKVAKDMQVAPQEAIKAVLASLQTLEKHQLAPAIGMLFGQESVGAAAQIVGNIDGLLKAFSLAGDSAQTLGSLQAEFDSMGNTTQQQMKKASEGVKTVTTALGMGLLPAINQSMATIAPMALQLSTWMQANQGLVTTIVIIVAAMMALKIATIAGVYAFTFVRGVMLSVQALLMTGRMAWLLYTGAIVASSATSKTAIVLSKAMAAAQWMLNAAMSANPIGLLIIAIVALVAAGVMLWRNWDQIVAGGKLLWQDFVSFLAGLWGQIASTATSAWQGMVSSFQQFGGWIVDGLVSGITGKLSALKDAVVGTASQAATWFKDKLGIASPSKVFTQFGGWISEGAAQGIHAGQKAVQAAVLGVAAAATVPMQAHAQESLQAPVAQAQRTASVQQALVPKASVDLANAQQSIAVPQASVQLLNAAQQINVPKAAVDLANAQQTLAVPQATVELLNATQQIRVPQAAVDLANAKQTLAVPQASVHLLNAAQQIHAPKATVDLANAQQSLAVPQASVQLLNAAQHIQVPKAAVDLANAHQALAVPQASVQLLNAAQQIQVPPAIAELVQRQKPATTEPEPDAPAQAQIAQPARIAPLAPRAAAAAPVVAGPSSFNITINATPGQDPQAIARAVAQELDRRERSKEARARASLHDRS